MARTVQLLDETLVDQIAAGEVIERPASLVKELLENAVDAGAGSIGVTIEDGGRALVRVDDDGVGMSSEDAKLCIERHATSKIASFDDLVHVRTLGFRGEALPSIGAVSRMTIQTRRHADFEGTEIRVEGGLLRRAAPCGCPIGTTVAVEDLFYNVPARKKFLRARQTESSKIFEICQRTALINPGLRLEVTSDGRSARRYLPTDDLAGRAFQAFGDLPFDRFRSSRDHIELEVVLAPAGTARPGPRHLFLYVNGRPVVDRRIARAVAFAYGDRLPPGHYPRGIVSLRLPAEEVDVNAHPQKTEVRFRHGARVLDSLTRILGQRLGTASSEDHDYWHRRAEGAEPIATAAGRATREPASKQVSETIGAYGTLPTGLRLIAQLRHRFLLCEDREHIYLFDRQRAEAVTRRERLARAANRGPVSSRALLFPDRIELQPRQREVLEDHAAAFTHLGFEWSALGEGTYALRAIPEVLGTGRARAAFIEAIEAAQEGREGDRAVIISAIARAGSTQPGEPMDHLEAAGIVSRLHADQPAHRAAIVAKLALPPTEPPP